MPAISKLLIISYIILTPFYFWASGIPQLSDIILIALIGWTATNAFLWQKEDSLSKSEGKGGKTFLTLFGIFTYYAVLVNFIWAIFYPEKMTLVRSALYLIFNFATMVTFFHLYRRYGNQLGKILYWSLTFSLVVQLIITILLMGTQGQRTSAFFNNPNQLGYYALLTASLLVILRAMDSYPGMVHYASLVFCVLISAASLSRGAIVATIFILFCSLIIEPQSLKIRVRVRLRRVAFVASLFIVLGLVLQNQLDTLLNAWNIRSESKGPIGVEGLSDRGYQRILENPQYWILGAGEGGYGRFGANMEMHSLVGNVFFSYGIIGLLLFGFGVAAIVLKNPYSAIAYIGVFVYGLSHNGIRDSLLWIMFAISGAAIIVLSRSEEEYRFFGLRGRSKFSPLPISARHQER